MIDGKFELGQLRHAYKQAVDGVIGDQRAYARNLLGPAVASAEKAWEERDALKAALEQCLEWIGQDSLGKEEAYAAWVAGRKALGLETYEEDEK